MSPVAQEIYRQLGGNRFAFMTGAKNFVYGDNMLQFSLSSVSTKNRCNHVRITLDQFDTYEVKFSRVRGIDYKDISTHSGIYNDILPELFERETGMYLKL